MDKVNKEKLITAVTFIVLIAAFAAGVYFLVRLVNGPDGEKKTDEAILSGELKTYTHPDYGFTFNYPANFKLGRFPEGEGEVILIQGEDGKQGFQIFVSLYEEKKPLSKAIIQESAPDLKIANFQDFPELSSGNPKSLALGGSGIKAFSFDTSDTHEIWFVAEGNLYQVTSYRDFGDTMEEIIKSLRFN